MAFNCEGLVGVWPNWIHTPLTWPLDHRATLLPRRSTVVGRGPASLWAATLGCHPQAVKHFPRAGAERPGLPGVDWLPGAPDSGQQWKQAGGGKQKRSHCEGEATGLFLL
ncbi:unnamed protein product [Tetraodon nigroviridis]|uniref:(spotted green pufferfish) hypothetical protein n=1 Tax=Tetraodon nigroviridis TaxID=99883 RepID=Q4RUM7_TETNG|nr:unnamed protein product [Tetraodon nigroviridis]